MTLDKHIYGWSTLDAAEWALRCREHGVPFRVVFLDLDGVINSEAWYHRRPWERCWFDPVAVALVSATVMQAGAAVVISSSWRTGRDTEWLRGFLYGFGFDAPIIDQTPIINKAGRERGHEIQQWLDQHQGVDSFAIIDDGSDMAHLIVQLVQTTWSHGFLKEHAAAVLQVLGCTSLAAPEAPTAVLAHEEQG